MTTTYTYVSRRNQRYFKYVFIPNKGMSLIPDNYVYLSTAKKISSAIRNYPNRRSFYFEKWENLRWICDEVVRDLGNDICSIAFIGWNEFVIVINGVRFEVIRKFSSDLIWKYYEISKII